MHISARSAVYGGFVRFVNHAESHYLLAGGEEPIQYYIINIKTNTCPSQLSNIKHWFIFCRLWEVYYRIQDVKKILFCRIFWTPSEKKAFWTLSDSFIIIIIRLFWQWHRLKSGPSLGAPWGGGIATGLPLWIRPWVLFAYRGSR